MEENARTKGTFKIKTNIRNGMNTRKPNIEHKKAFECFKVIQGNTIRNSKPQNIFNTKIMQETT